MKNYSSNRAQKGKTAFRTPSRWKAGQPEKFKRLPKKGKMSHGFNTTNSSHFGGHNH